MQDLKRAVERLAAAGFEDTLYDEAIVALDAGNVAPVAPVPMDPVLAPGVVAEVSSSVERDLPTIVRAFKSHLADYHLPDQVIEVLRHDVLSRGQDRFSQNRRPARRGSREDPLEMRGVAGESL